MHLSITSPLATALVSIESLTANITTDTAQDLLGVLGLKNSVHGPGDTGAGASPRPSQQLYWGDMF
jgi:hypothetical protein